MMKSVRPRSLARAAALALSLLAAYPAATRAQSIVNGSFEDPTEAPNSLTEITMTGIPGWTGNSIGGAAHEYVINGNIQDTYGRFFGVTPFGQQYLGLNAIYGRSFRSVESQVVGGLTAGQTYTLTLYLANLNGAPDPRISVSVETDDDGTLLASQIFAAPVEGPYGNGYIDFVPATLTFTATSDVLDVSIANESFRGVMGIDNVSLAAVPEPTTTAELVVGLGVLAGVIRRRRGGPTLTGALGNKIAP